MVDPIYLIVIALATAFALGLFRKAPSLLPYGLTLAALAVMTVISGSWAYGILSGSLEGTDIFTAGFTPPVSINLYMGSLEAVLLLLVNLTALMTALVLRKEVKDTSVYMLMLLLVFVMGLNGVIMTRDLFNLFVFIEIVSIASAGLIALRSNLEQLGAGFKFVIAGALTSGFMLIGIIFTYYTTGSLNMDVIASQMSPALAATGYTGLFLIFIGMIMELKPFPVNGWGLDTYEASVPAVSALVAAGTTSAMFYAFLKTSYMSGGLFVQAAAVIGGMTFIGMNVLALQQDKSRRLLGYSSIAQIGLAVLAYALVALYRIENGEFIVFALILTHALAKALLFWLAGIVGKDSIHDWGVIKKKMILIAPFAVAVSALLGLPPFPSFFAKWDLVMGLAARGGMVWIILILSGSLLEAVYLMRWFGNAFKDSFNEEDTLDWRFGTVLPVFFNMTVLLALGYLSASQSSFSMGFNWILLGAVAVLMVLDFLPGIIKNLLLMGAIGYYGYGFVMAAESYRSVFAWIFALGALITLLPGFGVKGKRMGFYPSAALMFAGLIGLIEAVDFMGFFLSWEIMTLGSYFLILRGKDSKPHALSYMLFSLGGAYLLMTGFAMTYAGTGSIALGALVKAAIIPHSGIIFALLAVGFMTKMASAGLHIWLPGAHAEAETDVSPMVSGILLKAGVFGLLMTAISMGEQSIGPVSLPYVLSWVAVITALVANYMAAMQEDAKRLLAYSSIGQMGYALFGISLMSHLGWLSALVISIVHFIYKVTLFLAIGSVAKRTGTRNMYQMGGLITKMPFTFFSVLICIIALSGIPPLAGFSGKWIVYNAVLEKRWMLQGAVAGAAGIIAFLYLFRLIFAIFLGQLKDNHRKVKEAPFFLILPQALLLGLVMFFSFLPGSLLRPVGEILEEFTTAGALEWQGNMAISDYGYWNGVAVMWVFMALFAVFFLILTINGRRAQWIKQFNIVFAAERPARPETTHFSYNFFAPVRKALGFLEYPFTTNFWNRVSDFLHAVAGFCRRIYTGNGQTYLLQMVIFVVLSYMLTKGGF
ncbi:MAG: proton-conducting transporter membrane subunit [Spirochaetales bacterium]|nr:proton-conducting transporter membrane subunit [Spirochaetales bacterium]